MDKPRPPSHPVVVDSSADWPNTVRSREELDSSLEAGLASGRSDMTWDEIIDEAKRELDN
jgi:hypothetical protein